MKPLKQREHDFSAKLRQASAAGHLRDYVVWRRNIAAQQSAPIPPAGPISINLDLTAACNFACPHCVDSGIINTGEALETADVIGSIDTLVRHGLRSVIVIGGGEPTLHKEFEALVRHMKSQKLQVGIVTNGTFLDKVRAVAGCLEAKDWVRISIDAASQDTFERAHRPRTAVQLADILRNAQKVKKANPVVSLGYSFVIVWEGIWLKGSQLTPNVEEMADAVRLASGHAFDYVSFKPCLIRLGDSKKESLLHDTTSETELGIRQAVQAGLERARQAADGNIKLLESVNLQALLRAEVVKLKNQPRRCHMQFFRTVLTPVGIYHCPALRGVEKARIGSPRGYLDEERFAQTRAALAQSIDMFDAHVECSEVGCFYHHANCWLDDFVSSGNDVGSLETVTDDNFFL
jgi:wyosine [tRNA(Phe)-imidazoG37] synthetase (radical SAM superfamily)